MKPKLPRKRKKAYIKHHGRLAYYATQIVNEILLEENPCLRNTKFAEFARHPNGQIVWKENNPVITFYW